jgi:hypothetical protein
VVGHPSERPSLSASQAAALHVGKPGFLNGARDVLFLSAGRRFRYYSHSWLCARVLPTRGETVLDEVATGL